MGLWMLSMAIGSLSGFVCILPFWILANRFYKGYNIPLRHKNGVCVYILYLMAVLVVTGIPSVQNQEWNVSLNLIPFGDIGGNGIQYIENIMLFIPFGVLLPLLWKRFRRMPATVWFGVVFSAVIELSQLFCFRATDIDDLFMNTLGTAAGYGIYRVICRLRPGLSGWLTADDFAFAAENEAYIFWGLSWLVMFFLQPYVSGLIWEMIL